MDNYLYFRTEREVHEHFNTFMHVDPYYRKLNGVMGVDKSERITGRLWTFTKKVKGKTWYGARIGA